MKTQDKCSCCRQPCSPPALGFADCPILETSTIIGLDERATIILLCSACRPHWKADGRCNGYSRIDRTKGCTL